MTILAFLVALTIIITAHELGHFLAAKKSGILVEEFNIGFPPRLWKRRIGETLYSFNLIPIGGYVKLFGENDGNIKAAPHLRQRAFFWQPWPKKLLVVTAGVIMNFLLGVLIFASLYSYLGVPKKVPWVEITAVAPQSPAAQAGLKPGDRIVALNNQRLKTPAELIAASKKHRGQLVTLWVEDRQSAKICPQQPAKHCRPVKVLVRTQPPAGQGAIGIVISNQTIAHPPLWQRPILGTIAGLRESIFWGREILAGLISLGQQVAQKHSLQNVAGPVGVYRLSQKIQAQAGWLAWLHFFGILSINLAIINILPLPALDGGQLVLVLGEAISRRRLNPRWVAFVNQIGLFLLLLFLLFLTWQDLHL